TATAAITFGNVCSTVNHLTPWMALWNQWAAKGESYEQRFEGPGKVAPDVPHSRLHSPLRRHRRGSAHGDVVLVGRRDDVRAVSAADRGTARRGPAADRLAGLLSIRRGQQLGTRGRPGLRWHARVELPGRDVRRPAG